MSIFTSRFIIYIMLLTILPVSPVKNKILPSRGLLLPSGKCLPVKILTTDTEHKRGLGGIKKSQWPRDVGAFFYFKKDGMRIFWMPDTYFNIDIVFLDSSLKIISIVKNLKAHPGLDEPPKIERTPRIYARHVLEIRSDSPLGEELKKGARLKWNSSCRLSEKESNTRLFQ